MKTIKPLGDNIILKGTIKQSTIILDDKQKDSRMIEKVEVFAKGKDAKDVKEGQRVIVNPRVFSETERLLNPFDGKQVEKEKEFYLVVKQEEIIGTL